METILLLLMTILGLLVMIGVIPVGKVLPAIIGIIFIFIFAPVLFGIVKANAISLVSRDHPWWAYIVAFFAALILLRLTLDFIFPGRRR